MRTRSSVCDGFPSVISIRRTCRLRPSCNVTLYHSPGRCRTRAHFCGCGALPIKQDTLGKSSDVGGRQWRPEKGVVLLFVAIAGVHEAVRKIAVVGHQHETRRVYVEPPDGE